MFYEPINSFLPYSAYCTYPWHYAKTQPHNKVPACITYLITNFTLLGWIGYFKEAVTSLWPLFEKNLKAPYFKFFSTHKQLQEKGLIFDSATVSPFHPVSFTITLVILATIPHILYPHFINDTVPTYTPVTCRNLFIIT